MSKTVTVSDQTGTEALAARLAAIAKPGDVILMHGSVCGYGWEDWFEMV